MNHILIRVLIILLPILRFHIGESRASLYPKQETWMDKHWDKVLSILLGLLLVLGLCLFLSFCFAVGGTESGIVYNGEWA